MEPCVLGEWEPGLADRLGGTPGLQLACYYAEQRKPLVKMPHVGYLCVIALNLMKTSVDDCGTSGSVVEFCLIALGSLGR